MEDLRALSFDSVVSSAKTFSIGALVDLSLLSKKRIALSISENQYVDLLGSFGMLIGSPRVLLVGNKGLESRSPTGSYSVYSRLKDKLSLSIFSNLKDVRLLIYIKENKVFEYQKTIEQTIINKTVSFDVLLRGLEGAGFAQVSKVTDVKQFCVKGGIVDLYSPIYQHPVRAYFYEDSPSFTFYDITSGLPLGLPIKSFILNKHENKTVSTQLSFLLAKQKFTQLSYDQCVTKGSRRPIKEVVNFNFKNNKKKIYYLEDIIFSVYETKSAIYIPQTHKRALNRENQPNVLVPGFEKGDIVCHEDFGIGEFRGLGGGQKEEEFLKIRYLDGTINLSIKKLSKVFFVSRETGDSSKIGHLNKKGVWKRRVNSVVVSAQQYVDNLVGIYTKKHQEARPSFVFGGELESAFLNNFEYNDTRDQGVAWSEIASDLEGDFPMSRLLCGDVGFGKTELAMRAVFRVVVNGGLAVVLCPTSILASQHFGVFKKRLEAFGVKVGCLVGGLSPSEKAKIKVSWLGGGLDVLVSTSAALYDDVFIKFASLFVVDEEHRFGVKQKEELVNKFVNKDVLFMSATPVPRTLHLSLSGVHNISTLSSPPFLRKPINTIVSYFSKKLIKQSISFELSRGGQVFYLHNRVRSISSVKSFLLGLCPGLRVAVVHSRLGQEKIREAVLGFINKKYDLLLCSSVIASGIDIPNANTVIIDNSHLFGLSQLHQIRGRVGRGGSQGFAYLLVPPKKELTKTGKQRLQAIEKNSFLGAGYSLSKADLNIRGAGSVFGYRQSGSFYDVGYEFYSKVISRCFDKQTKKGTVQGVDAFNYNVSFGCVFDKDYIVSSYERLRLYKELAGLYSVKDVLLFRDRLVEVYGPLLDEGKNLLAMRQVSVLCGGLNIYSLTQKNSFVVLFFNNSFIGVDFLVKFLEGRKTEFGVLGFVFGSKGDTTSLTIEFDGGCVFNGDFLRFFIGELNVACKN